MTVYLFGKLADIAGSNQVQIEPQNNSNDLIQHLEDQLPDLAKQKYLLSVNEEIIKSNKQLSPDDEVALLPPFSGG